MWWHLIHLLSKSIKVLCWPMHNARTTYTVLLMQILDSQWNRLLKPKSIRHFQMWESRLVPSVRNNSNQTIRCWLCIYVVRRAVMSMWHKWLDVWVSRSSRVREYLRVTLVEHCHISRIVGIVSQIWMCYTPKPRVLWRIVSIQAWMRLSSSFTTWQVERVSQIQQSKQPQQGTCREDWSRCLKICM